MNDTEYTRIKENRVKKTEIDERDEERGLDFSFRKWDMSPNQINVSFKDLNKESLVTYRALFNEKNHGDLFKNLDDETFYRTIGALYLKDDEYIPTNAAILLFGNYLQIKRIFPEYNLDYRENAS